MLAAAVCVRQQYACSSSMLTAAVCVRQQYACSSSRLAAAVCVRQQYACGSSRLAAAVCVRQQYACSSSRLAAAVCVRQQYACSCSRLAAAVCLQLEYACSCYMCIVNRGRSRCNMRADWAVLGVLYWVWRVISLPLCAELCSAHSVVVVSRSNVQVDQECEVVVRVASCTSHVAQQHATAQLGVQCSSPAETLLLSKRVAPVACCLLLWRVCREDPADDAAVVLALHAALNGSSSSNSNGSSSGERVILTADANRAWTLQQALCFAAALQVGQQQLDGSSSSSSSSSSSRYNGSSSDCNSSSSSSSLLAYIEEPMQDPTDMALFYAETGIAVALDESLDEGLVGPRQILLNPAAAAAAAAENGNSGSSSRRQLDLSASSGLAAVVIKPAVVGGFERAWGLVRWAQQQGLRAVVSSSFESSIGLAALVQLAAAADAGSSGSSCSSSSSDDSSSNSSSSSGVLPNGLWSGFGGAGLPSGPVAAAAGVSGAAAPQMAAAAETSPAAAAAAAAAPSQFSASPPQQQWHGLGTLSWFAGDAVPQAVSLQQYSASVPAAAAWELLQHAAAGQAAAAQDGYSSSGGSSSNDVRLVEPTLQAVCYSVVSAAGVPMQVTGLLTRPTSSSSSSGGRIGSSGVQLPVVLLHGFMGSASDWRPLMAATAAAGHPCLAVNLPGHGGTTAAAAAGVAEVQQGDYEECYSLETAAAVAEQAAAAAFGPGVPCLLVGYSMGARVALQSVLRKHTHNHLWQQQQQQQQKPGPHNAASSSSSSSRNGVCWAGAVIVSGTPGIPDPDLRAARVQKDLELADLLLSLGAEGFLQWWYQQPLWGSLRAHPGFRRLLLKRAAEQEGQEQQLAASLKYSSTGRMVSANVEVMGPEIPSRSIT